MKQYLLDILEALLLLAIFALCVTLCLHNGYRVLQMRFDWPSFGFWEEYVLIFSVILLKTFTWPTPRMFYAHRCRCAQKCETLEESNFSCPEHE